MSEIKTGAALDAQMVAKVKERWAVQTKDGGGEWLTVLESRPLEQGHYLMLWNHKRCHGTSADISAITALHAPTDSPSMEAAYRLGEPGTVTRAQAAKMLTYGWETLCGGAWLPATGSIETGFPIIDTTCEPVREFAWDDVRFIRSPGPTPNTYRIEG